MVTPLRPIDSDQLTYAIFDRWSDTLNCLSNDDEIFIDGEGRLAIKKKFQDCEFNYIDLMASLLTS
jgi:hypothetical protein